MDERYHKDWAYMSRYIRELFNYHCARCGVDCSNPEDPEKRLQVHHIDETPQNNHIENLIPLCAKCHLQIEHEARIHAPYHQVQTEFFEDHTYMSVMRKMRQDALEKFGKHETPATSKMTSEEYNRTEMDFNDDDFDY